LIVAEVGCYDAHHANLRYHGVSGATAGTSLPDPSMAARGTLRAAI
jgi:hypothetical protein